MPAILGANHLDLVDDGHVPASRERDHLDRATRVRREGQLVALLPAPQRDGIDSRLVFHTRISVVSFVFYDLATQVIVFSRAADRDARRSSSRPVLVRERLARSQNFFNTESLTSILSLVAGSCPVKSEQ